jgi:hypothetical protein
VLDGVVNGTAHLSAASVRCQEALLATGNWLTRALAFGILPEIRYVLYHSASTFHCLICVGPRAMHALEIGAVRVPGMIRALTSLLHMQDSAAVAHRRLCCAGARTSCCHLDALWAAAACFLALFELGDVRLWVVPRHWHVEYQHFKCARSCSPCTQVIVLNPTNDAKDDVFTLRMFALRGSCCVHLLRSFNRRLCACRPAPCLLVSLHSATIATGERINSRFSARPKAEAMMLPSR